MKKTPFYIFLLLSAWSWSQTTYLHCGQVFDSKKAKMLGPHTLVIEGEKITEVKKGFIEAGEGTTVVDLKTKTVYPGFIDMHVHIEGEYSPDRYLKVFQNNPADTAFEAAEIANRTLMAGFTSVRDLGGSGVNISLRNAIDKGLTSGPRIFTAGKAIGTTGGHADPTNGFRADFQGDPGPKEGVVNSVEDARKAIRQRYKNGADWIKITATGGVLSVAKSGQNPQFPNEELTAIKEAYLVATISAGKFVAEQAKKPGAYPAIIVPKAIAIGAQIQKTFEKAYKFGVPIAFGTDAGVYPHGENAKEFIYMNEVGMPVAEALQSATYVNAKILEKEDQLGQIAPGFLADLVATDENALDNINTLTNVTFVMKNGVMYKSE